jgi:hypothetical protein
MSRYTTRIDLSAEADEVAYELLEKEMKLMNFVTTITDGFGQNYQLPPGEYNIETNEDVDLVLNRAKKAATAVKQEMGLSKEASILVTESAHREWVNLDAVG